MEEVDVPWGVYVTLGASILGLSVATGEPELFSFAGVALGLIAWARVRGVKLPGTEKELNFIQPDLSEITEGGVDEEEQIHTGCLHRGIRHKRDFLESVGALGGERLRWGTGKGCNRKRE